MQLCTTLSAIWFYAFSSNFLQHEAPPHPHPASQYIVPLVKWVVASTPVCQDQAKTDGLEDAGQSSNSDGIEWALLGEDLRDELANLSVTLHESETGKDGW